GPRARSTNWCRSAIGRSAPEPRDRRSASEARPTERLGGERPKGWPIDPRKLSRFSGWSGGRSHTALVFLGSGERERQDPAALVPRLLKFATSCWRSRTPIWHPTPFAFTIPPSSSANPTFRR